MRSYDPWWHYEHDAETGDALYLLFSGNFSQGRGEIVVPIRERLLSRGDYFMNHADLAS